MIAALYGELVEICAPCSKTGQISRTMFSIKVPSNFLASPLSLNSLLANNFTLMSALTPTFSPLNTPDVPNKTLEAEIACLKHNIPEMHESQQSDRPAKCP
ncbi:hypothetical protein DXG01_014279 [Tephrocybe rancida]|nr:hypothetical protein DXG01_014279 [Tephrocybe rancida]